VVDALRRKAAFASSIWACAMMLSTLMSFCSVPTCSVKSRTAAPVGDVGLSWLAARTASMLPSVMLRSGAGGRGVADCDRATKYEPGKRVCQRFSRIGGHGVLLCKVHPPSFVGVGFCPVHEPQDPITLI
jgi:hypothetical protein